MSDLCVICDREVTHKNHELCSEILMSAKSFSELLEITFRSHLSLRLTSEELRITLDDIGESEMSYLLPKVGDDGQLIDLEYGNVDECVDDVITNAILENVNSHEELFESNEYDAFSENIIRIQEDYVSKVNRILDRQVTEPTAVERHNFKHSGLMAQEAGEAEDDDDIETPAVKIPDYLIGAFVSAGMTVKELRTSQIKLIKTPDLRVIDELLVSCGYKQGDFEYQTTMDSIRAIQSCKLVAAMCLHGRKSLVICNTKNKEVLFVNVPLK
jgi:hypothetical protein